jgi:hypothetical protein
MITFKRICIKDFAIIDGDKQFKLERGKEYTTSEEKDNEVMVFSTYWVWIPVEYFAGEQRYT